MIRSVIPYPSTARKRVDDIRHIIGHFDEFPQSLVLPVTEFDVEDGYSRWAKHYDGPNAAIDCEEPIVHGLLASIPPGVALDAACGTGRHARTLSAMGHSVIGVDATEAMLELARKKVPQADFRTGFLESLPVDDASVDLVTCALALTHVRDLLPVFREFARVLRPDGQAIISDIHPQWATTGGVAAFPTEDGSPGVPFVVNMVHQLSEYMSAFRAAGLRVKDCVEPGANDELLTLFPSYRAFPDATREAFTGMPMLLVWHLGR